MMTEPRFPEHPADHPLNQLPQEVFRGNQFEPQLTFEQRCSVLALYKVNVSVATLAAAFSVNRRTVNKIVDKSGTRYKNVRDEYARIGHEEFQAKYVTEDAVKRVAEAQTNPELALQGRAYDAANAERNQKANPRAIVHAGFNTVKLAHHDFSHRIEVSWLEANTAEDDNGPFEHPAGWYWRDHDGDTPERWNGDPENNRHFTSAAALAHARETI